MRCSFIELELDSANSLVDYAWNINHAYFGLHNRTLKRLPCWLCLEYQSCLLWFVQSSAGIELHEGVPKWMAPVSRWMNKQRAPYIWTFIVLPHVRFISAIARQVDNNPDFTACPRFA